MGNNSAPKEYLTEVRGQYEILPYPPRDPAKERDNLFVADGTSLDALNHHAWAGKRDFRHGIRVLVAGEGTGDTPIYMAEQLRDIPGAEIVAIDLSLTSIGIAKARLAKRGLTNVTHHHMSLLDLPNAGLGKFDVIECGGVLHHLEDPTAGLSALGAVLADDGIMAVMVYGFYGRLAVYLMQSLMQFLIAEGTHPLVKIDIARAFLKAIPEHHWLALTVGRYREEIEWPDGSGLYDLFLHSTDRAYTVPQIYDWVDDAGLQFGGFCGTFSGEARYRPEHYTESPLLQALFSTKSTRDRQAIAELLNGTLSLHYFYVTKAAKNTAQFADDMVPVWSFRQNVHLDMLPVLQAELGKLKQDEKAKILGRGGMPGAAPVIVTKKAHTSALLGLIDGVRTIGDMVETAAAALGAQAAEVRAELALLYTELADCQRMYLRHRDVPPSIQFAAIQARLADTPEIDLNKTA